ncbi:hypothetical protein, partial [Akkermansia sp.]|uniref:hypothetical protein n=1 Tax=Akkermansia sp. TaxID=1872421 RepID=UPI003AB30904
RCTPPCKEEWAAFHGTANKFRFLQIIHYFVNFYFDKVTRKVFFALFLLPWSPVHLLFRGR